MLEVCNSVFVAEDSGTEKFREEIEEQEKDSACRKGYEDENLEEKNGSLGERDGQIPPISRAVTPATCVPRQQLIT